MRTLTRKPQSLVVSRYAAAFRTLALSTQQTVLQSLRQLLTLFKTQQSLWRFLCCGLSKRSKHLIFEALLKKQGIHDKASHAFVDLLVQKNRLNLLSDLVDHLLLCQKETIRIVSAEKISNNDIDGYQQAFEALTTKTPDTPKKELVIDNTVQKDLLSGVVIIFRTLVIDASLKGNLERFFQKVIHETPLSSLSSCKEL
ncbi:MAG: ATP synthase F1 subunit delta [Holosporaceae bacterium]